ncbi:MAG: hypothetical protein KC657_33705 [Myxococcales bacterium]|nr:hypothetical protein [Myxococcales bacterium]
MSDVSTNPEAQTFRTSRSSIANARSSPRWRRVALGTTLAVSLLGLAAIGGCSSEGAEQTSSVSSATTKKCGIGSILRTCRIQTPYVGIKNTAPGGATTVDAGGCDGFNCANFAGNFCRCAENLCPGQVGELIYQASVHCTQYYNCDHVTVNHAVDIVCEPKTDDPTKKTCVCVEPQGAIPYEYDGSRRELGIHEDPGDDFCMTPVCTAFMGERNRPWGEAWRPCNGNDVHESCGNTNGTGGERCPSTCCKNPDGTVANHCLECDRSKLAACVVPDAGAPDVPVPVPMAVEEDAGAP